MADLTLEERGAFNTVLDLIYAHDGSIEDDDRLLAGWCKVDIRIWRRIRTRLVSLSKLYVADGVLRNLEADAEVLAALARVVRTAELNVSKGRKSGAARRKTNALVEPPGEPPANTLTATKEERDDGGDARARLLSELAIDLANQVMVILGIDLSFVPPGWCGAPMWFQAGLSSGWSPDVVRIAARKVAAKKRDGPPESFRYLGKPILREHELASAPMPTLNPAAGGPSVPKTRSVQDAVRDIATKFRRPAAEEPAPERQLPLLRQINRS